MKSIKQLLIKFYRINTATKTLCMFIAICCGIVFVLFLITVIGLLIAAFEFYAAIPIVLLCILAISYLIVRKPRF